MDYFKRLSDLLKTEREEDRNAYQLLTGTLSVAERRAGGMTWYPVAIRDTEMTRGDYLTVEVERTAHQDIAHQLRFGASAALFSNHDPKNDRVEGTITFQGGNRLKITLRTDELPDWSREGKLGIDLLFDDNSYDEMFGALKQATALYEKKEEGRLVRILSGATTPTFRTDIPPVLFPDLNALQQVAVNRIVSAGDLAIVQGPPGTGKTTTLVQAIAAILHHDPQPILVVAPSNTAVDWLSEKLSDKGLNVLRIGNPARVSERLMSLTLDSKMAEHSRMKEIKRLKKQASEFRDMAHKYKRNFGKAERDQRKALFDEARNILKEVERTEQFILNDVLAKAQVITATLVGANHYTVRGLRFGTVVIDEAGQALEPACWIPILKAGAGPATATGDRAATRAVPSSGRLILAGDHCQLPPTIKSDAAARGGLNTTLLEKCIALHPETVTLLEEQYRMHETIMGYSSSVFYGGKLTAHASVAGRLLFPGDSPLTFVDTAGCGFEEKAEGTGLSNPEEAAFLFRHLSQWVTEWTRRQYGHQDPDNRHAGPLHSGGAPRSTGDPFPTIAIISPYRYQVQTLQELLPHSPALQPHAGRISVNTIDSFQGQERDIVYISMTRSNADNKIGFLSEIRRMNVAMTRARKKLVVIGDSATLSQLPFYAGFIAWAEQQAAYRSAWEFSDT
jgi:ATP-dependent RNA/DNA helicase IGHMBP2